MDLLNINHGFHGQQHPPRPPFPRGCRLLFTVIYVIAGTATIALDTRKLAEIGLHAYFYNIPTTMCLGINDQEPAGIYGLRWEKLQCLYASRHTYLDMFL